MKIQVKIKATDENGNVLHLISAVFEGDDNDVKRYERMMMADWGLNKNAIVNDERALVK